MKTLKKCMNVEPITLNNLKRAERKISHVSHQSLMDPILGHTGGRLSRMAMSETLCCSRELLLKLIHEQLVHC